MASTDRQTTDPLIEEMGQQIHGFDFFQAVRLLQAHWRQRPRIGTSKVPDEDPVRFGQRPSLAFAPSTLDALEGGDPPRLFVHFFGLFGPNGPLPFHLTDYARRRAMGQKDPLGDALGQMGGRTSAKDAAELPTGRKDFTLSAFMDIFHHRFISLFFRAWACQQQTVDFDRPEDQRFPFYVGSFLGLANEADVDGRFCPFPDALPLWPKLYHAGWLASPTRNREGLEAILDDYFEMPVEIRTFVGRWFGLPEENRCLLGRSPDTGCLGMTAIVGTRTWQRQLSFRIRLGPMSAADLRRMLPGGDSFRRLRSWVLNYVGEEYVVEVQLLVQAAQVPAACLGTLGRLGWDAWLKSKPFRHDSEDVIFDLDHGAAGSDEAAAPRVADGEPEPPT